MAIVAADGIEAEGPGTQGVPGTARPPEPVPGAQWRLVFVSDRLVEPPPDLSALISAGCKTLLERGWHLAVCVTDRPVADSAAARSLARLRHPRRRARPAAGAQAHRRDDRPPGRATTRRPGAGRGRRPAVAGRDPPDARTGRRRRVRATMAWAPSRGSSPATPAAPGHAARQPAAPAVAAAHARAGGGLHGRSVRAGDQRYADEAARMAPGTPGRLGRTCSRTDGRRRRAEGSLRAAGQTSRPAGRKASRGSGYGAKKRTWTKGWRKE